MDGDGALYPHIFAYARGNRAFLRVLPQRTLCLLRFEAVRLAMCDLVQDIDWVMDPDPDPEFVRDIEGHVDALYQYLHLPPLHNVLMANEYYRMMHGYLQHRAQGNGRRPDDELRELIRGFLHSKELQFCMRDNLMPSIRNTEGGTESGCEGARLPRPSALRHFLDFMGGFIQHAAPIAGAQFIVNNLPAVLGQVPNNHVVEPPEGANHPEPQPHNHPDPDPERRRHRRHGSDEEGSGQDESDEDAHIRPPHVDRNANVD
jgi:hypothetical protein